MSEFKTMLIVLILLINVIGFIIVGYDKRQAKNKKWRVPERRFFIIAFFGGAIGVYFGMRTFRHKTKHVPFTFGIPLLVLFNLATFYIMFRL